MPTLAWEWMLTAKWVPGGGGRQTQVSEVEVIPKASSEMNERLRILYGTDDDGRI